MSRLRWVILAATLAAVFAVWVYIGAQAIGPE